MELLLNFVWLALAMAALAIWVVAPVSGSGRRREFYCGIIILACVMVLLFPVISANDDLWGAQLAIEDSPAAKAKLNSAAGQFAPALVTQAQHVVPVFTVVWTLAHPVSPIATSLTSFSVPQRAPPLS